MAMLENLPTVEEMVAALSSPIVPETATTSQQTEMSVEDMIREMFVMMRSSQSNPVQPSVNMGDML